MNKIIFKKDYHGFEAMYDIDRDVNEAFDERFNEAMKDIPGEFEGTVRVIIEYISENDK